MDPIMSIFERFNFSKTEALVYMDLLANGHLTGYQIAKNIGLSRSSVYNALNTLYRRGVVFLLPGENNLFRALEPNVLVPRLKREYEEAAKALEAGLSHLEMPKQDGRYLNIEGRENILTKASELIQSAKQDLFINTDFDPKLVGDLLVEASFKGVRCILFTFNEIAIPLPGIELYSHGIQLNGAYPSTRLMLTADMNQTLIASMEHESKYIGTFTENRLLARIVAEHIHHDIYLLKLKERYGERVVDETILLKSRFEKDC